MFDTMTSERFDDLAMVLQGAYRMILTNSREEVVRHFLKCS